MKTLQELQEEQKELLTGIEHSRLGNIISLKEKS